MCSLSHFLLLSFFSSAVLSSFLIGRLREGQWEYTRLNGWLTPDRAKLRCDRDTRCGGFTYQGVLGSTMTEEVFFFHLATNFEGGPEAWSWVTYMPDLRRMVTFSAIPRDAPNIWKDPERIKKKRRQKGHVTSLV